MNIGLVPKYTKPNHRSKLTLYYYVIGMQFRKDYALFLKVST